MKVSVKPALSEPLEEIHAFRLSRAQKEKLTKILDSKTFEVNGKDMTANDILRLKVDELIELVEQAESRSA
jgi:hypothetical protein